MPDIRYPLGNSIRNRTITDTDRKALINQIRGSAKLRERSMAFRISNSMCHNAKAGGQAGRGPFTLPDSHITPTSDAK